MIQIARNSEKMKLGRTLFKKNRQQVYWTSYGVVGDILRGTVEEIEEDSSENGETNCHKTSRIARDRSL